MSTSTAEGHPSARFELTYMMLLSLEIVLATLLPAFKFELSDKPIFWNAAGITYPSAGDYSTKPEMPLKVTMIRA